MSISDSEAVVMQVLWERHPRTADEVVEALADRQSWREPTIKTLLNRLLGKGAIKAERDGRRYLYTPLLDREAWLGQQSTGVVDRLFGGQVAPLVAHFSGQRALSREDIAELRRLIEELDDGR